MDSLGAILKRVTENRAQRPDDYEPPAEVPVKCERCKDFGFLATPLDLSQRPHVVEELVRCPCQPPKQISGPTFETFICYPNHPDLQLAFEATQNWVDSKGPGMLVLSGERGVGKSHLARAAFNHLSLEGRNARWLPDGELVDTIHGAFRHQTVEDWMHEFRDSPWLIIDDLGLSALNDTVKGFFDRIIDLRWQGAGDDKRTMYTTNLAPRDFTPRIASRLADIHRTRAVVIDAPDHRQKEER